MLAATVHDRSLPNSGIKHTCIFMQVCSCTIPVNMKWWNYTHLMFDQRRRPFPLNIARYLARFNSGRRLCDDMQLMISCHHLTLGNGSTLLYWTFPSSSAGKAKTPWHKGGGGYWQLDHPVSPGQNPESSSRWGELGAGACSLRCAAGYRSEPTPFPVLYKWPSPAWISAYLPTTVYCTEQLGTTETTFCSRRISKL